MFVCRACEQIYVRMYVCVSMYVCVVYKCVWLPLGLIAVKYTCAYISAVVQPDDSRFRSVFSSAPSGPAHLKIVQENLSVLISKQ